MSDSEYKGHNLVLVVGCPRSGTTWLQRLLASHAGIHTGQESDIFDIYIGPQLRAWIRDKNPVNSGRGVIGMGCYFCEEEFMRNLKSYMMVLLDPMIGNLGPQELFLEKTPSHALFIEEILLMLPEVRIIHLLRDPRDVIASLVVAAKGWGKHWAPASALGAARMWYRHVNSINLCSPKIPEGQFLELRYEQCLRRTREELARALSFLGLHMKDREMKKVINNNSVESTRSGKGTQISTGGEYKRQTGSDVLVEPENFVREKRGRGWRSEISLTDRVELWRFFGRHGSFGYDLRRIRSWV